MCWAWYRLSELFMADLKNIWHILLWLSSYIQSILMKIFSVKHVNIQVSSTVTEQNIMGTTLEYISISTFIVIAELKNWNT